MTPSPSKVQEVISIDLPRPRTPEITMTTEFVKYEARLTHAFGKKESSEEGNT